MKRNSKKKYFAAKRTRKTSPKLWLVLIGVVLALITVGVFLKKNPDVIDKVKAYAVLHHETVKGNTVAKPKAIAQNKKSKKVDSEPPLHFEFYTALPNMKVENADVIKPLARQSSRKIVDADDLERELSEEIAMKQ